MNAMMPRPVLTPLALESAALLRRLKAGTYASIQALADELGRDRSNTSKSLKALEGAALIARIDGESEACFAPTEWGYDAIAALDRADGEPGSPLDSNGFVRLTVGEVQLDPNNARKRSGLTPLSIEEMAGSIRDQFEAAGECFLQAPTVRDVGEPDAPVWRVVAGERRVLGWRLACERGWVPAEAGQALKVFRGGDQAATEAALIENLQRTDLDNLEAAEGLLRLAVEHQLTPDDIARRIGKDSAGGLRWVQELLKVAREADPADKDRYIATQARAAEPGYRASADPDAFTWTALRDSVKTPKHITALARTPRLRLLVLELNHAVSARGRGGKVEVKATAPGSIWQQALELGLVENHFVGDGRQYGALAELGRKYLLEVSPDLRETRAEALGPMGAAALPADRYGSDCLNVTTHSPPPPAPTPLPQGGDNPAGSAPEAPAPIPETSGAADPFDGSDLPDSLRRLAGPGATAPPPLGEGDRAEGVVEGATSTAPAAWTPATLAQEEAIIEMAALLAAGKGVSIRGGALTGVPIHDFNKSRLWSDLFAARAVSVGQPDNGVGYIGLLNQLALDWLASRDAPMPPPPERGQATADFLNFPSAPLLAETSAQRTEGAATPAATPAEAPTAPAGDPIIGGMREALNTAYAAMAAALTVLDKIAEGEGCGGDEVEEAVKSIEDAAAQARPYVSPAVRAQYGDSPPIRSEEEED